MKLYKSQIEDILDWRITVNSMIFFFLMLASFLLLILIIIFLINIFSNIKKRRNKNKNVNFLQDKQKAQEIKNYEKEINSIYKYFNKKK